MRRRTNATALVATFLLTAQPPAYACGKIMAAAAQSFWNSPEEVARRVDFLLSADWHRAVQRASYRHREVFEVPGPVATVDEAVARFAGSNPIVETTREAIHYRHRDAGTWVAVYPIEGTFEVERLDGPRHSFRGTVYGLTPRFLTNLELARATARQFVAVGNVGRRGSILSLMIPQRVARFGHTWKKGKSLADAIDHFAGEQPVVFADGYKVRIVNAVTGLHIVDDPEGQYYRLSKPNALDDVWLDENAQPVIAQDAEGIARTHFYYGDTESERPSLDRAKQMLRGEIADTSTTTLTPSVATAIVVSLPADFAKALGDPEPTVRTAELARIDWQTLTDEQRQALLTRAPTLDNSFEIGCYIAIAAQSGDRAWIPILQGWLHQWRDVRRGWQTFKRTEAESVLRIMR